ncbi:MAG: hypothetical protein AB1730_09720 [Myxococcota bacterium]
MNEDQLKAALNEQRKWGGRLGRTVVEMGFVNEADMVNVLAQQLSLRTVDLDQAQLPERITDCLRLDLAERYGVFPLGVDAHGHTLFIATSDPTNVEHIQELEFATNMKLELAVATGSAIDRAIRKYYFGENVVPTRTLRPENLGVNETTFELDELMGEAPDAPPSQPSARPSVKPAQPPAPAAVPGELAALKQEVAVLREQVQGLETISTSQVRALRVLLEILIESGLVTREEYLEHLHRPE